MKISHALAASVALLPAPALAQAVPDLSELVTQSEQINRGVDQATRGRARAGGEANSAIDGEAGIYVLTFNEIFAISASGGVGYTDNPERTADDLGGSFFSDASLSAGLATKLGGLVDFGLSATVAGRQFFEAGRPSSRTASSSLSLGLPVVGPVYAGVVAFGGYSFDDGFKNGTGFYGLSGNLSAVVPITQKLVLRPGIGGTWQRSEVSENDSTSIAASLDVIYAVTPHVSASLTGRVSRRWYDDFYEDVTFVARRDTGYGITAALSWQPIANVSFAASISYERQHSRFFLADYDALEGLVGVSGRLRF